MSVKNQMKCPFCGKHIIARRNPVPTVDIIIERGDEIVLIERKNPPYGWAIPGGFVDYGEDVESAAIREAKEETSVDVDLIHLLGVYSDPDRDPRMHTVSTVFVAEIRDNSSPKAADDAVNIGWFKETALPDQLVFDHRKILKDFFAYKKVKM